MKTLPDNFYTTPEHAWTTMNMTDLKELLLNTGGEIIACGKIWNICSRNAGVGAYKVYLKEWSIDFYDYV